MGKLAELREALAKRIFEALTGTAVGDYGTGGDPQLVGYTRLTGMGRDGKLLRDLTPMSQEQMIRIAHFLYAQNPLATRLIDQPIDLAIGSELGYTVEFNHKKLGIDEKRARELAADAKDVLDKFWDHPAHDIRCRANEYMTTLKVTGELCLPIAAENDVDGTPQLDYLDSQLVADVLPLEKSSLVPGTVLVRAKDLGPVTPKTIVRYDPLQDRLVGQCFFWRNGRLLNSMRGRSEFLNIADFLDSFDQFMFSQVDRGVLLNNIVWRLKMEGATEPQLLEAVKKLREQLGKPGGIWAHNEKGELEAVSPDLGSAEGSELLRTLGNHIRGSKGQPESWFGEGGNANRATAGEQTDVSYKGLIALQSLAKKVFGTLLEYAYDNLQVNQEGAGFPKRSTGAVTLTVDLPPVQERDIGRGASALTQLQSALEGAVETELLSKQTARKILIAVVEKVSGHALDADDEEAQIEAESEQRENDAAARAEMMARKGLETALNRGAAEGDDKPQPPLPPQANGNGSAREGHISTQALMEAIAKVAGVKPTDVHIHLPETLAASLDVPTPQVTVDVHVPPQPAPQVDVRVEAPAVTVPTPAVVVQVPPPVETVDEIVRGQDGQPEKIIRRQKRDDE
jgi:hypothetical protein